MAVPPGSNDGTGNKPAAALLKRIDIGLTTGVVAVFIAFMSLLVARAQTKMSLEAQKASVLPIIDIDLGYENISDRSNAVFAVRLNNVGAGIAHIQKVVPLQNGQPILDVDTFDLAVMNGRMRSNAGYPSTASAAGFLRAGETVTPRSYRMGAAGSELGAYLRGEFGTPMDGVDVKVCYCSVFKDCWTVKYLDRKLPTPVKTCGIEDAPVDMFQTYIDQTAAKRLKN
ncbi:MAG: hypothetical protein ABJN22_01760 [Litorimonas sp.]